MSSYYRPKKTYGLRYSGRVFILALTVMVLGGFTCISSAHAIEPEHHATDDDQEPAPKNETTRTEEPAPKENADHNKPESESSAENENPENDFRDEIEDHPSELEADEDMYWDRDQYHLVGAELRIQVPRGMSLIVFRHPEAARFQGFANQNRQTTPRLTGGLLAPPQIDDLTNILLNRSGNYVIVIVPRAQADAAMRNLYDVRRVFDLAQTRIAQRQSVYRIVNITSDGDDILQVELEGPRGQDPAGDYIRTNVTDITIQYQ